MKNLDLQPTDFLTSSPYDTMAQAVQRLVRVVREENAALQRMDFARAGELLPSKYVASEALNAAARTAMLDVFAGEEIALICVEVVDCLWPLMTENQKLHHRSAVLQKRVFSMVERLAMRANNRRIHSSSSEAKT